MGLSFKRFSVANVGLLYISSHPVQKCFDVFFLAIYLRCIHSRDQLQAFLRRGVQPSTELHQNFIPFPTPFPLLHFPSILFPPSLPAIPLAPSLPFVLCSASHSLPFLPPLSGVLGVLFPEILRILHRWRWDLEYELALLYYRSKQGIIVQWKPGWDRLGRKW